MKIQYGKYTFFIIAFSLALCACPKQHEEKVAVQESWKMFRTSFAEVFSAALDADRQGRDDALARMENCSTDAFWTMAFNSADAGAPFRAAVVIPLAIRVTHITITGDKATARIPGFTVYFLNIDDVWKIHDIR